MPKIVTRQTRIIETTNAAQQFDGDLAAAIASETDPSLSDAERCELWAAVATNAGQVQRRARQLAGLGRGG